MLVGSWVFSPHAFPVGGLMSRVLAIQTPCPSDINGDGPVNVLDLIDLLLAFGTVCP